MLRHKNKLMRAGRVEAVSALSERIGKEITWRCKKRLGKINGKTDAKDMWAAVRQLTGRQQEAAIVDRITAESLNDHYTAISTDHAYVSPRRKQLTILLCSLNTSQNGKFLKCSTTCAQQPLVWMDCQPGFFDWELQSSPDKLLCSLTSQ